LESFVQGSAVAQNGWWAREPEAGLTTESEVEPKSPFGPIADYERLNIQGGDFG
jgi:hypothetical protein